MQKFTVFSGINSFLQNRGLVMSLVKREIESKYKATSMGFVWVFFYPLIMLAVYSFVFGTVFSSRWGHSNNADDFIPMLYCGLIVHGLFAETLNKAPGLIINNPNYVKKVIFPLELLPLSSLITAIFNFVISFVLLLIFLLLFKHTLQWTIIFTPLVILPIILYAMGFAWFIAALSVFFRDLEHLIGVSMSMLLFLSPVFYSTSNLPTVAKSLLAINPISYPIEELRNVAVLGMVPDFYLIAINTLIAFAISYIGLWFFQQLRPAFADVI